VSVDARSAGAFRVALLSLASLVILSGCTGGSDSGRVIAWEEVPPTVAPTPEPTPEPEGLGGPTGPLPTTAADAAPGRSSSHDTTALLSPEDLKRYQPNEMGVVPILEYHVITTDPSQVAQFVRLADDMRADLEWLYQNDFYIVPLSDVVDNRIQVPPGKHPVALTFDDGTSSQFSYLQDANGELILDGNGDPVIDPDSAVGILEAYYAKYPDAGSGAHFAPLIFNGFAEPDRPEQAHLFNQKLQWMVDHGYEIGNHTWQHTNLTDIPNDEFMMTVAEPQIYMNELLGDHPGNASDILTLPYGSTPDGDLHPDQREMMRNGFSYNGHQIYLSGALLVGADPAPSPASTQYDKLWIPRIQMFQDSVDFWFGLFERDEIIVYTSDGNPGTITVPQPQHPSLDGLLDTARVQQAGMTVIAYNPDSGVSAVFNPAEDGATAARATRRNSSSIVQI
jgi:peptidoglycan/xylan/chitin deacetylase (PgdA/CDA1 family)